MFENISNLLPYATLISHIALVVLIVLIVSRHTWGRVTALFVGKHAIGLATLASLGAVFGSLYYSEVIGFEPCVLCWWQRIFLYSSALILAIAYFRKDRFIFTYVVPLVSVAAVVALYQFYSTSLGGIDLIPCTAADGDCSKVYVNQFGYITIEIMSLTISLFVLLFAWANKIYVKENSHSR